MFTPDSQLHVTPKWATNIVHTCTGIQAGEKVLIAVDEPLAFVRDILVSEVVKVKPAELRTIAEPGIGTNPSARLQGNPMTDEKVAGTIHVAIGSNDFLGGKTVAPLHIDGVVGQPSVSVDGSLIMAAGLPLIEV